MFVITDNGPYDAVGDAASAGRIVSLLYQPEAMRWRGVSVLTNTPPRSVAEPAGRHAGHRDHGAVLAKAARKLGIDQVAMHRINAPEGKAPFGPNRRGAEQAQLRHQRFVKEALDRARNCSTGTRRRRSSRNASARRSAASAWPSAVTRRLDWLRRPARHQAGRNRVHFQSGIGNLGTESVIDVHRVGAEMLGVPWEQCDVVLGQHQPRTCRGPASRAAARPRMP